MELLEENIAKGKNSSSVLHFMAGLALVIVEVSRRRRRR